MLQWDQSVRVTVGRVTLEIPAALVTRNESGIDSAAAVFDGGGMTVTVDQGPFANRLDTYEGRPGYTEGLLAIGGNSARTVFFREPEANAYTLAVHVPPPAAATVMVRADAAVPAEVSERIIDSVQVTPD